MAHVMVDRFEYLLDRIADAPFEQSPFPHLYLTDFLSEVDFKEVVAAREIALPRVTDVDGLFDALEDARYERIDFPGCLRTKEEYVRWLDDQDMINGARATCESQGLAFRLTEAQDEVVSALDAFFHSAALRELLVDKFDITLPVTLDAGIQKYLHGYEISPHPDIRKKALTWMLNVNPDPDSEALDIHTHYLRLKPEWSYITEIWRNNPRVETCWLPWDWCTTERRQVENNSMVILSPRWDTLHAIRARYDHLSTQRTQCYGNLWYRDEDSQTDLSPTHEDLSFVPRNGDAGEVEARLDDAERRAAEAEARLDRILANPLVRVARRARHLVRPSRPS